MEMPFFKKNKCALICGCGRFGGKLAGRLSEQDYDVTIIDISKAAFRKLPDDFGGNSVIGDATDIDVLAQNNAEEADVVVVSTNSDNTNVFIAEMVGVIFGRRNVYVRLKDDDKGELMAGLEGVDVISPFRLSMDEFERLESYKTDDM